MPRPGKRPYECERRAWHSDRHQPMRGSLIQEIFRVVNEIHSTATKNNKEWQEKLPIVVLRAEEIMYSKANSEAEYMDLKTLWDRANDAINTIIPRVESSTETGELLQPCIEAALYLGCTPRRGSRSQRNLNPSCYLSATSPEPICVPPAGNLDNTTNSPFISHISYFKKPPTSMNLTLLGSESHNSIPQKINNHMIITTKFPLLSGIFSPSSNSSSVHPFCHGNPLQSQASESGFLISTNLISPDNSNPAEARHHVQNFFPPENPPEIECDLSLRLGPLSGLSISNHIENSRLNQEEIEDDDGSSTSREMNNLSNLTLRMDKEFPFFPEAASADEPLMDSCSNYKWSSDQTESLNVGTIKRKREAISYPSEDRQFCWQPKLVCNHLTGGFEKGRFVD